MRLFGFTHNYAGSVLRQKRLSHAQVFLMLTGDKSNSCILPASHDIYLLFDITGTTFTEPYYKMDGEPEEVCFEAGTVVVGCCISREYRYLLDDEYWLITLYQQVIERYQYVVPAGKVFEEIGKLLKKFGVTHWQALPKPSSRNEQRIFCDYTT